MKIIDEETVLAMQNIVLAAYAAIVIIGALGALYYFFGR